MAKDIIHIKSILRSPPNIMSNGHHMSSSLPAKPDEDAGELIIDEDDVTNLSSDLGGPAVTPIEVSPEHAIFNSGMQVNTQDILSK